MDPEPPDSRAAPAAPPGGDDPRRSGSDDAEDRPHATRARPTVREERDRPTRIPGTRGRRTGPVEWVEQTGSTNDDLVEAARAGAPVGSVLVADHQLAGRGRRDRRWDAAPGDALLMSVLLEFADVTSAASQATTVVAVAAVEALAALGFEVAIKWPNDLVVGAPGAQRKLAGILAQAVPVHDRIRVVVGMGCNVVGARLAAPDAVALDELGPAPDRARLLTAVLDRLDARLTDLERPGGPRRLRDDATTRSATIGTRVRVDLGGAVVVGDAVAITDTGALVVDDGDTTREVVVGDVVSLRGDR